MHVILSTAMSVDGFIDDRRGERLILSNEEDLAAVQALRDSCDAIFVGAETIRKDNPSLSPRDAAQRQARVAGGKSPEPLKITMTRSGNLPAAARFFQDGNGPKLIYHAPEARLAGLPAELVAAPTFDAIAEDLLRRNPDRLLVEGGTKTATAFLQAGMVDEWRLAIAPFLLGVNGAMRAMETSGIFPHGMANHMRVDAVQRLGDMVSITYLLERTR